MKIRTGDGEQMVSLYCKICGALDIHPRPYQTTRNKLDEHLLMCRIAAVGGFETIYEVVDSLTPIHFVVYRAGEYALLCRVYQKRYRNYLNEWYIQWAVSSSSWSPQTFGSLDGLIYQLRNDFGIPI